MPTCLSCGAELEDFQSLAMHISAKKHRKGKMWAAKYLMVNPLSAKQKRPEIKHIAQDPDYKRTEFGNDNREKAVRVLSGENEYVNTHCPVCNRGSRMLMPQEYIEDSFIWRNSKGLVITSCQVCQSKTRRFSN
jgi:hypothetical protein